MNYDTHAYLGNNPLWTLSGLPVPLEGDAWVEMQDGAGIDGALVAPPGIGVAEDFKPDMDRIARAIKKYPARLFGFAD